MPTNPYTTVGHRDLRGNVVAVTFTTPDGAVTIRTRGERPASWRSSIYERNDWMARPRLSVAGIADNSREARRAAKSVLDGLRLPIGNYNLAWSDTAYSRDGSYAPGFIVKIDGYSKHNDSSIIFRATLDDGTAVRFDRYDIQVVATSLVGAR